MKMDAALIKELKLDTGFNYKQDEIKNNQSDLKTLQDLQRGFDIGTEGKLSDVWELDLLIEKYPDRPEFLNHKGGLYMRLDKTVMADKIIDKLRRDFPNYFFTKLMHGERVLREERFEEVLKMLQWPLDPHDKFPFPIDLQEYYNEEYEKRREKSNMPYTFDEESFRISDLIVSFAMGGYERQPEKEAVVYDCKDDENYDTDYQEYQEPFVREGRKIGRNEPCPCGSGKKYKKCCLNMN